MKVTIINGASNDSWKKHENALEATIKNLKADVNYFKVRDMDIKPCVGCFGCWVKSPGCCVIKDDMEKILESMVNSDLIIYATPLTAGFITSETKKTLDRSIPMVLPYIQIYNGECHHPTRYENCASRAIMIFQDESTDEEAVGIVYNDFDRVSLNIHSKNMFKCLVSPNSLEEAINEIISN